MPRQDRMTSFFFKNYVMNLIKIERVNTTNAWGFNGYRGEELHYDNGIVKRKAEYYYRHDSPSQYNAVFIKLGLDVEDPDYLTEIFDTPITSIRQEDNIHVYVNETGHHKVYLKQRALSFTENDHEYIFVKTITL